MKQLHTVRQLADIMQVSEVTIRRWQADGMPTKRVGPTGRSVRFDLEEVNSWMAARNKNKQVNAN